MNCPAQGMLLRRVRAVAPDGTRLAQATVDTIRLRLLKIAQVTVSVRRVHVRLCSACPLQDVFALAHGKLRSLSLDPGMADGRSESIIGPTKEIQIVKFAPLKTCGRALVLHWNSRRMDRRGVELAQVQAVGETIRSQLASPHT